MIEQINSQQKHLQQEEQGIDPIKSALTGDIFPLVASLDYLQFDTLVDTFSPLSHYICTLYIPLETLLNGRELPMSMNIQNRLPLSFAIKSKDAMATYYCLNKPHQLNTRSVYNMTPAMEALKSGFRIGFLLCFHFGHVTNDLANVAAQINDIWALKFLKSMKVPLNEKDLKQTTPLENAVANYSYECIDYLAKSYPMQLKMDRFGKIAKSKTIFNNLREIKSSSNESSSLLNESVFKQIFLLIAIFLSVNTFFNLSNVLYFDIVLLVQLAIAILYYNGPTIPKKTQKNIFKVIEPFLKSQLPQICPTCVQVKRPNYDHCSKCGICVQGFHFHSSVCISKCNQLRWAVKQFIWLIIFYVITSNYVQSINSYFTSSWKRIQTFTYLFNNSSYLKNDFILYSVCFFLLFKQVLSCFIVIYVILSGRTYQQVMNSQKYSSLYKPVQIAGQFYNRYAKNQDSTFKKRVRNGLSNLVKFIFG